MKFTTDLDEFRIDIEKGLYMGKGVDLTTEKSEIENVFIPWSDLAAHCMVFGTTRQGKSRLMAFQIRQVIEKGEHCIIVDPKGSENQEIISWITQYANENGSIRDLIYFSPEQPELSMKMNMIYGQRDEEAINTILDAMKVDEEFFEDVANDILMAILPSLTFYQHTIDPLVIEIVERMEYAKISIEDSVNIINKKILGKYYRAEDHEIKVDVTRDLIAACNGDKEEIKKIKKAYIEAKLTYEIGEKQVPLRKFVTFRDLARYSTSSSIKTLYTTIKGVYDTEVHAQRLSQEILRQGKDALDALKALSEEDAGFFSKVSKSYKSTMTKLSTGAVGSLLCDSKINLLRDKLSTRDKRVIVMVQPFPMKYKKSANMLIKMMISLVNSNVAHVGVSGDANYKRIHVFIDESGAVVTPSTIEIANKGGGLGVSLYQYSQSFSDYKETLGEDGAIRLADNTYTKAFFLMNDDQSAETVSRIIGSKKRGDVAFGANGGETSRTQAKAADEMLVPPSLPMKLEKQTFILKTGKKVYMMKAPFQDDPYIRVNFPYDNIKKHAEKYNSFITNLKHQSQFKEYDL